MTAARRNAGAAVIALTLALVPATSGADEAAREPARDERKTRDRAWYVPDAVVTQLAGNIGFISPGIGYALGRGFETDLFLGWVPEAVGGVDLFSLTAKLAFAPWAISAGPAWRLQPVRLSVQVTYTLGSQYFVLSPTSYHPTGYYSMPTAIHGGIGLGAELTRRTGGSRSFGVYAELVALDAKLLWWLGNRDTLGVEDAVSLALGARLRL